MEATINSAFTACSIIEGFDGEYHEESERIEAYAYLIRTGIVWSLQGAYGRTAMDLIRLGYITEGGELL